MIDKQLVSKYSSAMWLEVGFLNGTGASTVFIGTWNKCSDFFFIKNNPQVIPHALVKL